MLDAQRKIAVFFMKTSIDEISKIYTVFRYREQHREAPLFGDSNSCKIDFSVIWSEAQCIPLLGGFTVFCHENHLSNLFLR